MRKIAERIASGERIGDKNQIECRDAKGLTIKNGDRIKVLKGSHIHGTFPGHEKVAKRSYTVTVFGADVGWNTISPHRDDVGRAPKVCWAGTGGYWHYTDADNVEVRQDLL